MATQLALPLAKHFFCSRFSESRVGPKALLFSMTPLHSARHFGEGSRGTRVLSLLVAVPVGLLWAADCRGCRVARG